MDDRIETFLIQWIRGAGPEGLAAISPVRMLESAGDDAELVLARPWLEVSSNEIAAYVKRAKLTWVEDDSNADTRFLRNLIRNDILPPLDAARKGGAPWTEFPQKRCGPFSNTEGQSVSPLALAKAP